jgi:hypothetical protein
MHINCIKLKLPIIHTHEPSHVSGINRHPQGDINTKAYILLKHHMYPHNVKIYNSSYKYNNVHNMDSMMLTYSYFWLRFISMPLFTMCVVIHTQTASTAVSDPVWSSPCALYWCVLCRRVCMNNTTDRIVHVQRKEVSKGCQKCHLVIKTMWANCILGVFCFLASCF